MIIINVKDPFIYVFLPSGFSFIARRSKLWARRENEQAEKENDTSIILNNRIELHSVAYPIAKRQVMKKPLSIQLEL